MMKKLSLFIFIIFAISSQAQDTNTLKVGNNEIKKFSVKLKTKSYDVQKFIYHTTPLRVNVEIDPNDWIYPQIPNDVSKMTMVGQTFFQWDESQFIKIITEEFQKSRNKFDAEAFYKGKTFYFNIYGDPKTLKILHIKFASQSDYIKDYSLIESIDNRIRKEFVFKVKKDYTEFRKLPIFSAQWGIQVEKIKL